MHSQHIVSYANIMSPVVLDTFMPPDYEDEYFVAFFDCLNQQLILAKGSGPSTDLPPKGFKSALARRDVYFSAELADIHTSPDAFGDDTHKSITFNVFRIMRSGCEVFMEFELRVPASATIQDNGVLFKAADDIKHHECPMLTLVSVEYPVMVRKFFLFMRCIRAGPFGACLDVLCLIQEFFYKMSTDRFVRDFTKVHTQQWRRYHRIGRPFEMSHA